MPRGSLMPHAKVIFPGDDSGCRIGFRERVNLSRLSRFLRARERRVRKADRTTIPLCTRARSATPVVNPRLNSNPTGLSRDSRITSGVEDLSELYAICEARRLCDVEVWVRSSRFQACAGRRGLRRNYQKGRGAIVVRLPRRPCRPPGLYGPSDLISGPKEPVSSF